MYNIFRYNIQMFIHCWFTGKRRKSYFWMNFLLSVTFFSFFTNISSNFLFEGWGGMSGTLQFWLTSYVNIRLSPLSVFLVTSVPLTCRPTVPGHSSLLITFLWFLCFPLLLLPLLQDWQTKLTQDSNPEVI